MKVNFNLFLVLIIWTISNSSFSQSPCHLVLDQNKLLGECKDKLFTGIEIILDKNYDKIDSTTLFKMLPKDGFLILQKKHKIAVQFVITERAGFPQIMLKPMDLPRVGWYTFDSLRVKDSEISFLIDKDPDVPFSNEDLEIITHVKKLFKDSLHWNNNDDRRCEDDIKNDKYSFFCALQTASMNVVGEYNHRNAVMQLMRRLIEKKYPNKEWKHRFKDFNNMPETSFDDIMEIIEEANKIIRQDLEN